jgi:CRP-like cAMP-binding protein
MSTATDMRGLRERITGRGEDRLGRALSDLLENPLLTGALGRAFDARERAAQAQELAMGALNIPSAADIERLTRRLRAVSQRLEGIEDGVDRIGRSLATPKVQARLDAIEEQLGTITRTLGDVRERLPGPEAAKDAAKTAARSARPPARKRAAASKTPAKAHS